MHSNFRVPRLESINQYNYHIESCVFHYTDVHAHAHTDLNTQCNNIL